MRRLRQLYLCLPDGRSPRARGTCGERRAQQLLNRDAIPS